MVNGNEFTDTVAFGQAWKDAKAVAKLIKKKFKKIDGDIIINDIGTTIGSHTGPGTVALLFWGDERVD